MNSIIPDTQENSKQADTKWLAGSFCVSPTYTHFLKEILWMQGTEYLNYLSYVS